MSVQVGGMSERCEHDECGDPVVCGDMEGVAGVVVEPGDDLAVRAGCDVGVGESVVGEVGLPGLVGLFGFESDVGGFGSLGRVRGDLPCSGQDPVDRGPRQRGPVVVLQVPLDGVGAGI